MKQNKRRSSKPTVEKGSHHAAEKHSSKKLNQKAVDMQQLSFEVEVGIFEVDKIFEGQGDKLSDSYVADSLESFVKVIKENTYGGYSERLKEGSDDESDMLHINIVNRVSAAIEELELEVSDAEIIEVIKTVQQSVKKAKSAKSSRAYLDPLAKRLKEMGFKSDFLTEADVDGETLHLEDIDDIDDLGLDENDGMDDFRP